MEALNLVCVLYIFRKTLFNPMFLLLFPEDENDVSFRLPRLIRRDIVAWKVKASNEIKHIHTCKPSWPTCPHTALENFAIATYRGRQQYELQIFHKKKFSLILFADDNCLIWIEDCVAILTFVLTIIKITNNYYEINEK